MAAEDETTLALLNFYCQEKLYHHMQSSAVDAIRRYGSDAVLIFFKAYGLILEGSSSEAMRELESIKDNETVHLCATMALIYAHKKSKSQDREAMQDLDAKLKEERKSANDKALFFAGLFLWHTGRHDKAREYVDRSLKMSQGSVESMVLRAWIDMTSGRDAYVKKSSKYFEEVLNKSPKHLQAMMGKSKLFFLRHNYSGALELINEVVVSFPGFMPALVEKMRLQLALQDWEQTIDTAQRALTQDSNCLEALRLEILHFLCRDGSYDEASARLGELIQLLDRFEPKNPDIYLDYCQTYARLCARSPQVLQQTYTMVERAMEISPNSAEYPTEAGYQLLLQGRTRDAFKCYKNAMKLDETSVVALTGMIRCQLLDGNVEDAEQQLEFLGEIQESIGKSAEILYLKALLARKKNKPREEIVELLNEASQVHFASLKGLPLGTSYFTQLNPDFVLEIVQDYLLYAPTEPQAAGQPVSSVLQRCNAVLEPITKAVPGLVDSFYLIGKVRYLMGQVDQAQASLQKCLDAKPQFADAHLLMAQIYLYQGNFQQSQQSLEMGLSYNFEVREMPLYHLIRARAQKKMGQLDDCVKTLQTAMNLSGVKKRSGSAARRNKGVTVSLTDRASVYLELAEAYRATDAQHEAAKVMQDAIHEFTGTPEEIRITISNAELALHRGDIEQALSMLRNVTPEQSYFVQARVKMGDIYLNHRKDRRLYIACIRELSDKQASTETSLILGDAYMNIQETEKAITIYEQALKKNPKDSALASKIGQAYVKTHQYGKAIAYYEAALKTGGQSILRLDLGELLLKLRQYEKAEKHLQMALEQNPGNDLPSLMEHTKLNNLLAKVHQKANKLEDAMLALSKARDLQGRVLKRVQMEQPESVQSQKTIAASICSEIAEHCTNQNDLEKAAKFYKEALVYSENNGKAMLELARLYLSQGELDQCQHQLVKLLQIGTDTDAATVMMADLMFRKGNYEEAMFHFQQLLQQTPAHFVALSRLIDLLRRAGKLEDVPGILAEAEKSSSGASMDPGLSFCKGLYEWYVGNPTTAVKHFNMARKDSEWGERATENMITICINPDNDTVGGETFDNVGADSVSAAAKADSEQSAVRTAERLLKEVNSGMSPSRVRVLENYALMASKSKANIEKALSGFMEMATTDPENIPALLGMATAYMMLKQTPRARNQLKRIAKMDWNPNDADEFEKSWLLLSDIYINSGKYDMATDLLKKCLQHNQSSSKAYEYLGFIMEKEQSYQDAAFNYERAWTYSNQSNPSIGYKLAFNYMKAKKYVDAIDICHKVLSVHSNYPRMRKDILEKARLALRT
ncbi:tetratricopeptide repeat protein 21B-like isoform X2 [Apostichopus japonicus]|uniref:tetratricopeptide repeat protein 21B-like isoform X2 n=1 Tax=Stichopus japonicus TaxID=307972 RepID=UPI003AB33E13